MMRPCLFVIVCAILGAAACGTSGEADQSRATGDRPAAATAAKPDSAGERRAATAGKRFSRVPPDQVDPQRREAAESFAKRYEQTRAQGSFAPLGDEATEDVRTSLTVEKQKAAQQQITAAFGEFESLEYVEAWRANASPESTIYRFRATFTKGKPEIRVVHDEQGKISGFWLKPWRDSLEPPRPQKLPEDQVNSALRDASMAFAMSYLEQHKAGVFTTLGNQVTDAMRAGLTPEKQAASHAEITSLVGKYESLTYVATYRVVDEPGTTIFRFRGTFTAGNPEVRVVHNADGKVSGLWIKPWRDEIN
jgi:hypothetical protein